MGNSGIDAAFKEHIRPVMLEIIVSNKGRDLGVGICYASQFQLEPAHVLGRALGEFYRGDEYRIIPKAIGRSAFNPQRKPEKDK